MNVEKDITPKWTDLEFLDGLQAGIGKWGVTRFMGVEDFDRLMGLARDGLVKRHTR